MRHNLALKREQEDGGTFTDDPVRLPFLWFVDIFRNAIAFQTLVIDAMFKAVPLPQPDTNVRVARDPESGVYVAHCPAAHLFTEGDTFEEVVERCRVAVPDFAPDFGYTVAPDDLTFILESFDSWARASTTR